MSRPDVEGIAARAEGRPSCDNCDRGPGDIRRHEPSACPYGAPVRADVPALLAYIAEVERERDNADLRAQVANEDITEIRAVTRAGAQEMTVMAVRRVIGGLEVQASHIVGLRAERDAARAEVASFVSNEAARDGALSDLGTELEETRASLRTAGADFARMWTEVLSLRAQLAGVTATRDKMIDDIKDLAARLEKRHHG